MLEINNLNKSFNNKVIFNNLNITFNLGLNFIIGHNGVGKTTLLNIISKLDNNYNGKICDNNLQIYYNLIDDNNINCLSIIDNLLLVSNDMKSINYYLDRFNLTSLSNKKTSKLSKGQKAKVAIIRSLLSNNNCLIFDEPTANLDPKSKNILFEELQKLDNKVIIIATNETEYAYKYYDNILNLDNLTITTKKKEYNNIEKTYHNSYKNKTILRKYAFSSLLLKPFIFISLLIIFLFSSLSFILYFNFKSINQIQLKNDILELYNLDYIVANEKNYKLPYNKENIYSFPIYIKGGINSEPSTLVVTDTINNIKIEDNVFYLPAKYNNTKYININNIDYNIEDNSSHHHLNGNDNIVIINFNTYKDYILSKETRYNIKDKVLSQNNISENNIFYDELINTMFFYEYKIRPMSLMSLNYDTKLYIEYYQDLESLSERDVIITNTALYSSIKKLNFENLINKDFYNLIKDFNYNYKIAPNLNLNDFNIAGTTYLQEDNKITNNNENYIYLSDSAYYQFINKLDERIYFYEQKTDIILDKYNFNNILDEHINNLSFNNLDIEFQRHFSSNNITSYLFYISIILIILGIIIFIYYFYSLNKEYQKDFYIFFTNNYTKMDLLIIPTITNVQILLFSIINLLVGDAIFIIVARNYMSLPKEINLSYSNSLSIIFSIAIFLLLSIINYMHILKISDKNILKVMKHE